VSDEEEPTVVCAGPEEWRAWLEEHHAGEQGAWLKIAKKGSGIASVSHAEALDVAICFGWIDAVRHAHDDDWFLQRFTPRRARSKWSQVNRDKAEGLIVAGEMRPFLVACYRLDAAKYPTVLPSGASRPSRSGASSLGLVLAAPPRIADPRALSELALPGDFVLLGAERGAPEAQAAEASGRSQEPPNHADTYPYRKYFLPPPGAMFRRLKNLAVSGDFQFSERGNIARTYPGDYEAADGISNHFTEDVRARARTGAESPAEVWASMRMPPVDYASDPDAARRDQALLYEECRRRRSPEANIFNAAVAVYLYTQFRDVDGAFDVLDPSAGWGDRLIAALACPPRLVRRYVGYDPNAALQRGYGEILDAFGGRARAQIEAAPFEDVAVPSAAFDLVMTSPPFYDLETYVTVEEDVARTQSTTRYASWPEWLEGMYRPYLAKAYSAVRSGGFVILYVSDYTKSGTLYPLARETLSEMARLGAALEKRGAAETGGPPRPFFVFRRPERAPPPPPEAARAAEPPQSDAEPRVLVRDLRRADAERLHAILAEPDNARAGGRERTLASVEKMIDYSESAPPGEEFFFALELGGRLVGYAGFRRATPEYKEKSLALSALPARAVNRRDVVLEVYTGAAVAGSGVFRRAYPRIAEILAANGVRSVLISTYADNVRARRAFEALGAEKLAEWTPDPPAAPAALALYRLRI